MQRLDEPHLVDFLGKGARNSNPLIDVSWGSTKRVNLDEKDKLIEKGKMIRFVELRLLHPFLSGRIRALID